MGRLTHVDGSGKARMVNVGAKDQTPRVAVAEGCVRFGEEAFHRLEANDLEKGDAMTVARLAGIQAAKRTAEWIPLCHTVPLECVEVTIGLEPETHTARVTATASARWSTGVEMEAMVAVSAACLSLYDMAKAIDRGISFDGIRLLSKSGGRSGEWRRSGE